jgi:hypothetical protein
VVKSSRLELSVRVLPVRCDASTGERSCSCRRVAIEKALFSGDQLFGLPLLTSALLELTRDETLF